MKKDPNLIEPGLEVSQEIQERFAASARKQESFNRLQQAHAHAMMAMAEQMSDYSKETWELVGAELGVDLKEKNWTYHDGKVYERKDDEEEQQNPLHLLAQLAQRGRRTEDGGVLLELEQPAGGIPEGGDAPAEETGGGDREAAAG